MKMTSERTWHESHRDKLSIGQRMADYFANNIGSWRFVAIQSIIIFAWMALNIIKPFIHWDEYPYALLGLVFALQAAYFAPIILMAQNRQIERDRVQADADYKTNCEAKAEIEELQKMFNFVQVEKLDRIIEMLDGEKLDRVLSILEEKKLDKIIMMLEHINEKS